MKKAKMKKKKIELAKKEAKINKIRKAKIAEAEKKKKAKQKQKQKKMSIKRSTISVKSFKNYELINLTTFLPPKNKSLQFTNNGEDEPYFTKEEIDTFLEQLNSKQFKKIEKFFETMPKLKHTIDVVNPKTQVSNHIVLEGLSSFFD